jgi:hypothetical protein
MPNAPIELPVGLRPGDVVAGKYRVERVLGVGGMGVVVAAQHLQLDEKIALKVLLPEVADNPEAVARFLREARAAVKIKSEHVVRVTDVGTLESGAPFMVMEYLDGGDLSSILQQVGPLPVVQAVDFVLGIPRKMSIQYDADASRRASLLVGYIGGYAPSSRLAGRAPRRHPGHSVSGESLTPTTCPGRLRSAWSAGPIASAGASSSVSFRALARNPPG